MQTVVGLGISEASTVVLNLTSPWRMWVTKEEFEEDGYSILSKS